MRRLTKTEAAAAAAVLSAAAGVAVSGAMLLKQHTEYLLKKAAAVFSDEDESLVWPDGTPWNSNTDGEKQTKDIHEEPKNENSQI